MFAATKDGSFLDPTLNMVKLIFTSGVSVDAAIVYLPYYCRRLTQT